MLSRLRRPVWLTIEPTLDVTGGHWAAVSDVKGVGSKVQGGLQAVEGLGGVIVERGIGGTISQQAQEAAGEHVACDQVALVE